jgi:hypothetical protein
MDKHIELDFVINQHNKHLDFDNDYVNNEQVLFLNHILNLQEINLNKKKTHLKYLLTNLPVNGRQSNILKSGQYCSALFVDVHVRYSIK